MIDKTQFLKLWRCLWNEGAAWMYRSSVSAVWCEAARAAGQWRQTGRETEVIWRDKTSSDMTCWSGSKHRRYSAEPTQEHRSLPPSSSPVSFLLSFSPPIYLSLSSSLPLLISVTAPLGLSRSLLFLFSLSLTEYLSLALPLSPHAVS